MAPENIIELIPLFSGLGENIFETVGGMATIKNYKPGEIIVHEGEVSEKLYFITHGKVKVSVTGNNGKELILDHLSKGDYFGDPFTFEENNNCSCVTILSDSELLIIRIDDFQKILLLNTQISIRFLLGLAKRIRLAEFKILLLSFANAQVKVAALILQIAEMHGEIVKDDIIIAKFPPYAEIANMTGMARETVSRILHRFADQKFVTLGKLKLTILDYKKFWKMFELSNLVINVDSDSRVLNRSSNHLTRRYRFPILNRAALKKMILKYPKPEVGLAKNSYQS